MGTKKRIRPWMIVLTVLVVTGGIVAWKMVGGLITYKDKVARLEIGTIDLTKVPDGTWPGSCDLDLVNVKLEIVVKDHRIEEIHLLEHKNGKGVPAEDLLPKIVETQQVDLDVVSGATASSKAILRAVEDAAQKASA